MEQMEFKEGDHVRYFPTGAEQNPSSGVIEKIIHERQQVGAQVVKASEEMPRYVIKNDKTHKEAAYKLENIIEKLEEGMMAPQEAEREEVGEENDLEEGDEVYNPEEEEEA